MMYSNCSIKTPGKWILTGEHSVLRGGSAIVFPMLSKQLTVDYTVTNAPASVVFQNNTSATLIDSFWKGMCFALSQLQLTKDDLKGQFIIHNQIPIGQGMGASAALSVAIALWFVAQGKLQASQVTSLATNIEHLYHGKSSGLDIAGVQAKNGVVFCKGQTRTLSMQWQPHWVLSFCGKASNTADCITKVQAMQTSQIDKANDIDAQMQLSASMAEEALNDNSNHAAASLIKSMHLGLDCFERWGLVSPAMQQHLNILTSQGALAAKPTGSGAGGYAISLWKNAPPRENNYLSIDTATLCYKET